jgi:cysteine desulfurase
MMNYSHSTDGNSNQNKVDSDIIYLDFQATTPIDARVSEAMKPFLTEDFANPHSNHLLGHKAEIALNDARTHISKLIGCYPAEIIFTSGATESNNLAILGLRKNSGAGKNHVISLETEHKCVLAALDELKNYGFEVELLPVKKDGLVDLSRLRKTIRPETLLVSIMSANNEIGVIQPLKEIGEICLEKGTLFHTDAAQAVGRIPLNVEDLNIDMLSISGHKIYGPKGIGALYVRSDIQNILSPLIHGGGQENGLRSGTAPTPLCFGIGKACQLAEEEMDIRSEIVVSLRDEFLKIIVENIPNSIVNGSKESRIAANLNITFPGVTAEGLLSSLQNDVAASTGSACTSGSIEPSHVLSALGLSVEEILSSVRFSFGHTLDIEDVRQAARSISNKVNHLISTST